MEVQGSHYWEKVSFLYFSPESCTSLDQSLFSRIFLHFRTYTSFFFTRMHRIHWYLVFRMKAWVAYYIKKFPHVTLCQHHRKSFIFCIFWIATISTYYKILRSFDTCLSRAIEVFWFHKISNKAPHQLAGQIPVDLLVRRHNRQWIGYILRKRWRLLMPSNGTHYP